MNKSNAYSTTKAIDRKPLAADLYARTSCQRYSMHACGSCTITLYVLVPLHFTGAVFPLYTIMKSLNVPSTQCTIQIKCVSAIECYVRFIKC